MQGERFLMAKDVDASKLGAATPAYPVGAGGDLELSIVSLGGTLDVLVQQSLDLSNWFVIDSWKISDDGENALTLPNVIGGYIRLAFNVLTDKPMLLSIWGRVQERGDCGCQ